MKTAEFLGNFPQLDQINQSLVDSLNQFGKFTSSRSEELFNLHKEVVGSSFDSGMKQLQALSESKKPEDFLSSQLSFASEAGKQAVANAQKYFDLLMKTNNDVSEMLQENWKSFSAKAQNTVKGGSATKAA